MTEWISSDDIWQAIRAHGGAASVAEIAAHIGRSETGVRNNVRQAVRRGHRTRRRDRRRPRPAPRARAPTRLPVSVEERPVYRPAPWRTRPAPPDPDARRPHGRRASQPHDGRPPNE